MRSPSLLQRLKERKLVQWALAYLAGAWVLVEATGHVVEQFQWPVLVSQVVTILAFFGFFVVLVIAWYHGEKGRQWVSGPELLIIALLLLISGGVLSTVGRPDEPLEPSEVAGPMGRGDDDRPRLAVLPCDNLSGDPADEYLASALHDEILLKLQGISSVFSTGRASVEWYKENPAPLSQVAQELSVGFVGECSVQKYEEQIRLIFQLLDGRTGGPVWAEDYDRDLTIGNLFDIQTDIAEQVALAIGAELTPGEKEQLDSRPTENQEAQEEYLKGRFHWGSRSTEGLETAVGHFQRAVSLDPTFAQAYAGLADCYAVLPYYSPNVDPRQMYSEGERAAQAAIELAPDMAEAHASLGYLGLLSRRDWAGAERKLLRAIDLDPSYSTAHHWLSDVLAFSGRFEEAIVQEQRALELDPLSFISNFTLGQRFYWSGQNEAAIRQLEETVRLYPQSFLGWAGFAEVLFLSDSIEYAVTAASRADELFGLDPAMSEALITMTSDYYGAGVRSLLPPEFDTVIGFTPVMRARMAVLVGDSLKALYWLERAAQENWPDLLVVGVSSLYDPLRDHPRFQTLLEQYRDDLEH